MSEVTVLLSSAGRRGALLETLRDGGRRCGVTVRVVAIDRSPLSAAGQLADSFHLVPSVNAPDFGDRLEEIIEKERVDAIVPTIDHELPILSTQRPRLLELGAATFVSDPATIEICADKSRSSAWLAEAGFGVPRQYSRAEANELAPEHWPLFFKPLAGSSSVGAHPVADPPELSVAFERFGPGVVEELIVGEEYTVDCWVDDGGRCRNAVPRHRLETRAGEVSKGMTVRHDALQAEVTTLLEALPGARGPMTVQAIAGPDGHRFIEINPRFGGGYPLSHEAGAFHTTALVASAVGMPLEPSWFEWEDGLLMLRYDAAVFVRSTEWERP